MHPDRQPPASSPSSREPIDYDRYRAIAAYERRKAISAFPGAVRRWLTLAFRKLFSTSPPFRVNSGPWHSTSRSAASAPPKRSKPR
jgi:hypothetical protein